MLIIRVMVETGRLIIVPLTREELELYLQADNKFEGQFRLSETGRTVSPDIKDMVLRFNIEKMKSTQGEAYLFYTFWIIVEKSSRIIVGELGFKGEPLEKGGVEIGYGTMHSQRGKGFMTEAVGGMIGWAKTQPVIDHILAETDEYNVASIRILQKNNFHFLEKKGKMFWWKIVVK
jgi:ribosomal-protein-alanine N-acetyltransferase